MLETRLISRIQHLNARGLSSRSIARGLGVSKNTVKKYLRNPALLLRRDGNGRSKLQPCYDYPAKLLLDDPSIPANIAFREANAKGFQNRGQYSLHGWVAEKLLRTVTPARDQLDKV